MAETTEEYGDIMPIGELCNELGISTRTLRYWEEERIIETVERLGRGNRGYTPYMVRRIRFILKLKDLGLTIKELKNLYKIYGDAKKTDQLIPELVNILDVHIDLIDDKVAKLSSLRKEIVEYRQRLSTKLRESI